MRTLLFVVTCLFWNVSVNSAEPNRVLAPNLLNRLKKIQDDPTCQTKHFYNLSPDESVLTKTKNDAEKDNEIARDFKAKVKMKRGLLRFVKRGAIQKKTIIGQIPVTSPYIDSNSIGENIDPDEVLMKTKLRELFKRNLRRFKFGHEDKLKEDTSFISYTTSESEGTRTINEIGIRYRRIAEGREFVRNDSYARMVISAEDGDLLELRLKWPLLTKGIPIVGKLVAATESLYSLEQAIKAHPNYPGNEEAKEREIVEYVVLGVVPAWASGGGNRIVPTYAYRIDLVFNNGQKNSTVVEVPAFDTQLNPWSN